MFPCCSIFGLLLMVTVPGYFLSTLQQAIGQVAAHNRRMSPEAVWLNLVPGIHLYWGFVTVDRIAESLARELVDRGIDPPGERPSNTGRTAGECLAGFNLFAGGASIVWLLISLAMARHSEDAIGQSLGLFFLASVPAGICFIVYWVQLAGTIARLKRAPRERVHGDWDDDPPSTAIERRDV